MQTLKATQRGWIKGRNDCWKNDDQHQCVIGNYERRISELQAKYGLVKPDSSFVYICSDGPQNPIEVTFFSTEILTAKAKREDQQFFMYGEATGIGKLYKGPNESISIHQNDIKITWGYDAKEIRVTGKSVAKSESGFISLYR